MFSEDFEGDGEQCVASEDGDPFAEDLVVCWATTAQIVIVHAGEIVVDEGVGVDALDGGSGGQRIVERASARLGCCDASSWT